MSEWIMTDNDSMQHAKKLSDSKFELVEMGLANPVQKTYQVYTATIDVSKYTGAKLLELLTILGSYSYTSVIDVKERYGEAANQIIAECIFEYYGTSDAEILFEGSEDDCVGFIENFVAQNKDETISVTSESGETFTFRIVDKIPSGYKVWNINIGTCFDNYAPLCINQVDADGLSHVQMSSLAAIELLEGESAVLRRAAACGVNCLDAAKKGIKSEDSYVRDRAEKAVPIFQRISE